MITETLMLEGEMKIDNGYFFLQTASGWLDLRDAFKHHFFPDKPSQNQEVIDYLAGMPATGASPDAQLDFHQRYIQSTAIHAGMMRITFEPLDGQNKPLVIDGECGIDSGEFYIEGQTSGLIFSIFLRHFQIGPDEEDDEDDYGAGLGRFKIRFEPVGKNTV